MELLYLQVPLHKLKMEKKDIFECILILFWVFSQTYMQLRFGKTSETHTFHCVGYNSCFGGLEEKLYFLFCDVFSKPQNLIVSNQFRFWLFSLKAIQNKCDLGCLLLLIVVKILKIAKSSLVNISNLNL